MTYQAVQMIGTQRSGSNLLRLMLNQLPDVSAPHPPHIIERFMPLLPLYGDVNKAGNFRRLALDVCALVTSNPVAWQNTELSADELISRCINHSLVELSRVIYEHKAQRDEACIWICKSMANIHYSHELEMTLKPLYLFLYRDGRDVACSFKKAVVGEKHTYFIAKQWKEEQEKCISLQQQLQGKRFIAVCYEALIAHPEAELRRICTFIGTEYSPDCLQYYRSGEAANTASSGAMWQNVKQQVISGNKNKYLAELSAEDLLLFERVAGSTLQKLGYPLHHNPGSYSSIFSEEEIQEYAAINAQLKFEARLKQTPEDTAKRKQQDVLLTRLTTELIQYNAQLQANDRIAV